MPRWGDRGQGGLSITEADTGITFAANDVPKTVVLRSLAAQGGRSLHVHPALRQALGQANFEVSAPDWETLTVAALDALDVPYALREDGLLVAATEHLEDDSWLRFDRGRFDRPSRQIVVDVSISIGDEQRLIADLLLTEDNWAGIVVGQLHLNVWPWLLDSE